MMPADADAAARAAVRARRAGRRSRSARALQRRRLAADVAAARRDRRPDGDRQERARHRARAPVRRRDRQLRFDGRLSRLRHRHRQGAARASSRAFRITWSTSPIRPRSTRRRATRARRRRSIRDITARGTLPILVGGTGLYYRALTRGFFPGPGRDDGAARAARARSRDRAGPSGCTAGWRGSIRRRPSAFSRATCKRLIRALEVYLLTGRPLTAHFADTHVAAARVRRDRLRAADSAGGDGRARGAPRRRAVRAGAARRDPRAAGGGRSARPRTRSPGSSTGRRSSTCTACATRRATRELIVRENRKYARRQLIWFRKEPNLQWIHAAGEREETLEEVARALAAMESRPDGSADP